MLRQVERRVVDVPVHRLHRGKGFEFAKDAEAADVAGVKNAIHAGEGRERFSPHQTVRVRDQSDAHAG